MWGWLRRKRKEPEAPAHAPGSVTLVGRVDEITISGRRKHGCLGGPLVFETPPFTLALVDGRRATIEPSWGAVVEGWEALASPPPPEPGTLAAATGPYRPPTNLPQPPPGTPPPSALPPGIGPPPIAYTPLLLGGELEVHGLVPLEGERFAVPPGYRMTVHTRASRATRRPGS